MNLRQLLCLNYSVKLQCYGRTISEYWFQRPSPRLKASHQGASLTLSDLVTLSDP